MPQRTLDSVPCPVCSDNGRVRDIKIDEDVILNAKRTPVIVPAKCENGHSVVLFVDRNFTIRDVEIAGEAVQGDEDEGDSSIEKAQRWMADF
ncbi:MAG: hypothetical protein KGY80_11880 [Candidatus Thorarchaeota archaeon]|nr:hypothetical protein [Candidatus Thorarchaeota archaeon]